MFRMWFKEWKDNRMIRDTVVEDSAYDTRTHKVFRALETACSELDLAVPVWLDSNIREFKRHARTRFSQDSFMEEIDFDSLEAVIIEED